MPDLLLAAHILGVAVYLTAGLLATVALSAARRRYRDQDELRQRCAVLLRIYSPVAIAALGLVIMTGAWSLTGLKESLGAQYFSAFGRALAVKLALSFLITMLTVGAAMGIGLPIVKQAAFPTDQELPPLERRLLLFIALLLTSLLLTLWTAWFASGMARGLPGF